jgi:tRNA-specific 2-thiouridylase
MSGGVDSSVAAWRLVNQGYQVSGIFMQNWEDDDEHCTARQDYRDAKGVADLLGIPLTTVNFADEYWERVFAHFLKEYSAGRTPNPDILCNKEIKFSAFLDHAHAHGADAIATGHYAQVGRNGEHVQLLRGADINKDQSYFLYTLNQKQVGATLFPVGDLDKTVLRQMALDAGIHVHNKKDSTGICFIGERKFNTFLAEYLPAQPGEIRTDAGDKVGEHNGLMFYTLGQRQGLGIGGLQAANDEPWYVLDKQLSTNTLIVGQGHDHPMLFRSTLDSHDMHWVHGAPPAQRFDCTAKVRYRQQDQQVSICVNADGCVSAEFAEPVRAITPGQSMVLYQGDVCLGGGVISDFNAESFAQEKFDKASSTAIPPYN